MQKKLYYQVEIYQNPEDKSELSSLLIRKINDGVGIMVNEGIEERFPHSAEFFFDLGLCEKISQILEENIKLLEIKDSLHSIAEEKAFKVNEERLIRAGHIVIEDYFTGEDSSIHIHIGNWQFKWIGISIWPTQFQSETEIGFDLEEAKRIVQAFKEALE